MARSISSTRPSSRAFSPSSAASSTFARKKTIAPPRQGDEYNHLLVLAENEEGYRNLVRITSEASLHGFYRKPRISKKYLAEHAKGLIGFSGCLAGELCENLMAGKYEAARATASQYQDIFGRGNFFLEIQDQGLELEKKIHADLFRLEKDLDIPLVATNDSHYLCEDDAHAHEVLLCVQTLASINDPKRFKFDTDQFYIKSAAEMERLFAHAPEVVNRTMQFAERCHLKLSKVDNPFPEFAVPPGHTIDSYFEQVCREGLTQAARNRHAPTGAARVCCAHRSMTTSRGWTARSTSSSR